MKILPFVAAYLLLSVSVSNADVSLIDKYLPQIKKMKRQPIPELTQDQQKVLARITFYHNHQDQYGSKIATGGRARQGVTLAAHPDFKFGTPVQIPALKSIIGSQDFIVQDRGSAVTAKRASRKKTYVFDVYIQAKNKREGDRLIRQYASQLGEYTYIFLKKNG